MRISDDDMDNGLDLIVIFVFLFYFIFSLFLLYLTSRGLVQWTNVHVDALMTKIVFL